MAMSIDPNAHLLETAYQIGRFIQSHVTEKIFDESGKPWSYYSAYFRAGPNPLFFQMERGLVLEECDGIPSYICTPYGRWHILGAGLGDWPKIMDAIKDVLGLELIKERRQVDFVYIGPFWAITQWAGIKLDKPVFKQCHSYISYEKVKEVWTEFVECHFH